MQPEFIEISKKCKVKLTFTDKKITSYGGLSVIAKLFEKLDFQSVIEQAVPFLETSPNGTGVFAKVLRFGLTVLVGGKRFTHSSFLGDSMEIFEELFSVRRIPQSITSLTRFFERFVHWWQVEHLSEILWDFTADHLIPFKKLKEDFIGFDSSVLTRYGDQQGTAKGYNPKKPGRPSHHPICAFLTNGDFILNLWNRPGNVQSRHNIIDFAKQTFTRVQERIKVLGVLADSGFYDVAFFEFLELIGVPYIIAVVTSQTIQREIAKISDWRVVTSGIHAASFMFQHQDEKWLKPRRYVVIRKDHELRPEALGKQLDLFGTPADMQYRYSTYITSLDSEDWPEEKVWEQYKKRAGDENIFREIKYDFAFEGFVLDGFWATEATMLFKVLFYNLIQFFRSEILKDKDQQSTLHTIRHKILVIPAILGQNGSRLCLRLGIRNEKKKSKIKTMFAEIEAYFLILQTP
ncbi:MAG: IS1380 family transposase [Nanoarchaeota archaeon]